MVFADPLGAGGPGVGPFKILSFRVGPRVFVETNQRCFRAGNRASGSDFGRILVGKASKSVLRPAEGRPEGRL